MTGLELASKINRLNDKVNLFLMTAFTVQGLVNNRQYADVLVEMVIQKPLQLKTLKEYLNNAITPNNANSIIIKKINTKYTTMI